MMRAASEMELVRYANVAAQKPPFKEELVFIARCPEIAKELLTMSPLSYPVWNSLLTKSIKS